MPEGDDDLIARLASLGNDLDELAPRVALASAMARRPTVHPQHRRTLGGLTVAVIVVIGAVAWLVGNDEDPIRTVDDPGTVTATSEGSANAGPCGEGALAGDVDGDGEADLVNRYDDVDLGPMVRVCLADGREMTILGQGEALTLIDVEPDGRVEILNGPSSDTYVGYTVYTYNDGDLGPVALFDDALAVGEGARDYDASGEPTETSAFGCEDLTGDGTRELVKVEATFTESRASWEKTGYELSGGFAINVDASEGTDDLPSDRLAYARTLTSSCSNAGPEPSDSTTSTTVPGPGPSYGPDLQAPEPGREITFDGAGDVQIGQVLDASLVTQYESPGPCGYWGPVEPSHNGDEPPGGLVADAHTNAPTIRSIVVGRNSTYRTASGVGVGTRLETLQRIYAGDLVVDRADGWDRPTAGLLASYNDVAAIRNGGRALTFVLTGDVVSSVKISAADFWGDDEGCA